MELFSYYFKMKSRNSYLFDGLYVLLLCVFFIVQFSLFIGSDPKLTFLEVAGGSLQSHNNVEKIMIPFLPIIFIFPIISILFSQIFYIKQPNKFINIQIYFYFIVYFLVFVGTSFVMKIFMGSRLIPEVSIWQILALVIYFSAIFIFLKLMNVIYIFTNNKITTVLMVYLLCYGDLFLQKLGIQLFFAHGFMKDAANASKQVFLKNSLFLLLLFTILEVAQRWMIFEKNYIKKAK